MFCGAHTIVLISGLWVTDHEVVKSLSANPGQAHVNTCARGDLCATDHGEGHRPRRGGDL